MTAWTTTIATGIAQLLHDTGVGIWSPDDPYGADETIPAIFLGGLPDEPEQAISIRVRPYAPTAGVAQVGIQVVIRDADLDATAQAVMDTLHDRYDHTISNLTLPHVWLQSWGDDLTDAAGAPVVSLNFYSWASFTTPGTRD